MANFKTKFFSIFSLSNVKSGVSVDKFSHSSPTKKKADINKVHSIEIFLSNYISLNSFAQNKLLHIDNPLSSSGFLWGFYFSQSIKKISTDDCLYIKYKIETILKEKAT